MLILVLLNFQAINYVNEVLCFPAGTNSVEYRNELSNYGCDEEIV